MPNTDPDLWAPCPSFFLGDAWTREVVMSNDRQGSWSPVLGQDAAWTFYTPHVWVSAMPRRRDLLSCFTGREPEVLGHGTRAGSPGEFIAKQRSRTLTKSRALHGTFKFKFA